MFVTRLVDQKWQERMGQRDPRAPPEPMPPSAETAKTIESLERRLIQVETKPQGDEDFDKNR
eukprot:2553630-Prorocentrum_lima.AAC.1